METLFIVVFFITFVNELIVYAVDCGFYIIRDLDGLISDLRKQPIWEKVGYSLYSSSGNVRQVQKCYSILFKYCVLDKHGFKYGVYRWGDAISYVDALYKECSLKQQNQRLFK